MGLSEAELPKKKMYDVGKPTTLPCDDHIYGTKTIDCSDAEWEARVDLAAAYRLLQRSNVVDAINNHLTATIPGQHGEFLVHPFGLRWSEVTASNLVKLDVDGKVLSGVGCPEATAFWIHSRMHMKREEKGIPTGCIMHNHQPWTTSLICVEEAELPMIHQTCLFFYNKLVYEDYNGLVLNDDEGTHLAEVLGDKPILMHRNHGVMVCGETVAQAFDRIYYLEKASEIAVKAMSTGKPLKRIPVEVCEEFSNQMKKMGLEYPRLHFEACKRDLLRGEDADFIT